MSNELVVRQNVIINAPAERVWNVLVTPLYIRQWNELIQEFTSEEPLQLGSEMVWNAPNGDRTTFTVIELTPYKKVRLSLYNTAWTVTPNPGEVGYTYTLSEQDHGSGLSISVGDFSKIPHGTKYYEASLEFAKEAARKIKELAEGDEW